MIMDEYVTRTQFWEGMRELATDLKVPVNTTVTLNVPEWFIWVVIALLASILIAVVFDAYFKARFGREVAYGPRRPVFLDGNRTGSGRQGAKARPNGEDARSRLRR